MHVFLEQWFQNEDLRPLLVVAVFLIAVIVAIVLVEHDHRKRVKATTQGPRTPALTLLKGGSAEMFDGIEEFQRDFDGPNPAS